MHRERFHALGVAPGQEVRGACAIEVRARTTEPIPYRRFVLVDVAKHRQHKSNRSSVRARCRQPVLAEQESELSGTWPFTFAFAQPGFEFRLEHFDPPSPFLIASAFIRDGEDIGNGCIGKTSGADSDEARTRYP